MNFLRLAVILTLCAAPAVFAQAKGKEAKAQPAAAPPKPGLTSCAGKIEGRYAEASVGQIQMEFRSGKATMKLFGETDTVDCWMSGKKIYLYKKGESSPMEIDINDDGSLQSPIGELKKKGA